MQPLFPEPLTVQNNVADAPYRQRVWWLKQVLAWHSASVFVIAALAKAVPEVTSLYAAAAITLLLLVALTFVRRLVQSDRVEKWLNIAIMVPLVLSLSQLAAHAESGGWPLESLALASFFVLAYCLLCGPDFSFMGMFTLSCIGSIGVVVVASLLGYPLPGTMALACATSCGFLAYIAYDLSMVIRRRRLQEKASAVTDLYRDVLNWTTYLLRIWLHWRRYRFQDSAPDQAK